MDNDSVRTRRRHRDAWRGPVTDAMRQWGARPDLLADPDQRDGEQVWTTSSDVLVRSLRVGDRVVAAWGDATWTAVVQAIADEGDELWLSPPHELVTLPAVNSVHRVRDITLAVLDAIGVTEPPERVLQMQGAVARVLSGVLGDFQGAVDTYEDEVRSTREVAHRVLQALRANDPPKRLRKLLNGPAGEDLARLARLPR